MYSPSTKAFAVVACILWTLCLEWARYTIEAMVGSKAEGQCYFPLAVYYDIEREVA
jgi:hypothetical protein